MSDTQLHAGIEVGDTVYTGGWWHLFGKLSVMSGVVVKKSSAGRLAVKGGHYSSNYSDTLWFKTEEEVLANYRALAEAKISGYRRDIVNLEELIASTHAGAEHA